nr:putative reverse transcriptase domain-containing protein [Tanacetum cinerariifolium]
EDPYHLLDYDEEEDPEMDTEERIMPPKPMSEARMREIIRDHECKEKDRVKFAMATLRGRALTWSNRRTKSTGIEAANNTPWSEVKK